MAGRPRLPSPRRSNEDYDDDEEEEDGLEREEVPEYVHVYQSLDRQERSLSRVRDDIYAQPLKRDAVQSEGGEETDDSLGIVSPLPKEEIEVQKGAFKKSSTPKLEQSPSSSRSMLTADFTENASGPSPEDNHKLCQKKTQKKSSGIKRDGSSG